MVVVKIELWPNGDQTQMRPLGALTIANDTTGTEKEGNYNVEATHGGIYFGKKPEPYKRGRVLKFQRGLSVYRLLFRALRSINET